MLLYWLLAIDYSNTWSGTATSSFLRENVCSHTRLNPWFEVLLIQGAEIVLNTHSDSDILGSLDKEPYWLTLKNSLYTFRSHLLSSAFQWTFYRLANEPNANKWSTSSIRQAKEILFTKRLLNRYMSEYTDQPVEKIEVCGHSYLMLPISLMQDVTRFERLYDDYRTNCISSLFHDTDRDPFSRKILTEISSWLHLKHLIMVWLMKWSRPRRVTLLYLKCHFLYRETRTLSAAAAAALGCFFGTCCQGKSFWCFSRDFAFYEWTHALWHMLIYRIHERSCLQSILPEKVDDVIISVVIDVHFMFLWVLLSSLVANISNQTTNFTLLQKIHTGAKRYIRVRRYSLPEQPR